MVWFLGDLLQTYGSTEKALNHYFTGNGEKTKAIERYVRGVFRVWERINKTLTRECHGIIKTRRGGFGQR
jgi:hypothetical protein